MALIHTIDHPAVSGIRTGRVDAKGNYHLTASCIIYQLGNTIIDTGPSREWPAIHRYFDDKSIKQALLTHHHEDHSGNARHFQQRYGTVIHSHPNNHRVLSEGLKLSMIRKVTFGSVKAFTPEPLPAQIELDNGNILQTHHMPGHTNDLCCFFEPNEGWLFTGDLYVSSTIKYMTVDEDVDHWIKSLEQALSLDFDTLFCSHRAVVSDGKLVLEKKLDFINSLRQEVAHWHNKGYSEKQITRQLLGRKDAAGYLSFMHMSKRNLTRACLASLAS